MTQDGQVVNMPVGERTEFLLPLRIDYETKTRWEPVHWRLRWAAERTNDLRGRCRDAVGEWDGQHPQVRAPRSAPKDFEIVGDTGSSREFHLAHLREITLLASEVIHHVRSALDYIAYQLVVLDTGSARSQTQFPICDKPNDFRREATRRLNGVTPEHVALVESVQPYNGAPWTGWLKELSDRDKHRFPVDVSAFYNFWTNLDAVYLDPLGADSHRGYQVEQATLSFRFVATMGPDGAELEVVDSLTQILHGAAGFVNKLFDDIGLPRTGSVNPQKTRQPQEDVDAFGLRSRRVP